MSEDALRKNTCDSIPGRGAAGMDDAAPAVAALEPEAVVELDSELDEIADPCGRLLGERQQPRSAGSDPSPARSVSSAWSSGESSSPTAAAIPPCASELVDESSGPLETSSTSLSDAAHSAPKRPATPLPTTRRSHVSPLTAVSGVSHASFRL